MADVGCLSGGFALYKYALGLLRRLNKARAGGNVGFVPEINEIEPKDSEANQNRLD